MGLGNFLGDAVDFFDPTGNIQGLVGGLSGETAAEAAGQARDITNEELLRQFDITQENLRPSLEAAQRTLPGLESQLTAGGFGETLGALGPQLEQFLAPTQAARGRAGSQQLAQAGIGDRPGLESELSRLDPALMADLLLGAEADLFGNRLSLAGLGEGAGGVLSELGQRTGAGLAQSNIQALQQSQQATAAGQQNAIALAGLAASFSDERLKEDIQEIGRYKGLRLIKWKWRDFVPESWRDITFGFSAQEVLNLYPQFVSEINGFLSIDRDNLIHHLEAA